MRNVSNYFKQIIKNGGPFYAYADVTLADGSTLSFDSHSDFYVSGNKYTHAFSSDFPLGEAVCKTIDIGIDNSNNLYSAKKFEGAVITLYTEIDGENNSTERLLEGIFTVLESTATGDIIEITAGDNMCKTDKPIASDLRIVPIYVLAGDICTACGLTLATPRFRNDTFRVSGIRAGDATYRQVLGYIAQIAGGNAYITPQGEVAIKSYTPAASQSYPIVSGQQLDVDIADSISGGELGTAVSDIVNGGNLSQTSDLLILKDYVSEPKFATDDITITGVSCTRTVNNVTTTDQYGTDGYVIKIDNPLISGNAVQALKLIGDTIIGIKCMPFSGDFSPNPTVELMDDVFVLDAKGTLHQSFITSHTFTYLGGSNMSNECKSQESNNATYKSGATQVYQKTKELVNDEHSAWSAAVDNLQDELDTASGLFETRVQMADQSYTYYFHDKPTLEESQNRIRITSQAMAISTDGGVTYPTGITVDGNAVVAALHTVGINADWVNITGALKIGGANNDGTVEIYDANDDVCGRMDNRGLTLYDGVEFTSAMPNGDTYVKILPERIIMHHTGHTVEISHTSSGQLDIEVDNTTIFTRTAGSTPINNIYGKTFIGGDATINKILPSGGTLYGHVEIQDPNLTGDLKLDGRYPYSGSINYIKSTGDTGYITVSSGIITSVS